MKHYGYGKMNEKGERLIQLAQYGIMNIVPQTFCKKNPNVKLAWKSPNGEIKNSTSFFHYQNKKRP